VAADVWVCQSKEVEEMLLAILVTFCVVAILASVTYAFVRPFTHFHHHHPSERLWRPLD
jgi:hypothetical protein